MQRCDQLRRVNQLSTIKHTRARALFRFLFSLNRFIFRCCDTARSCSKLLIVNWSWGLDQISLSSFEEVSIAAESWWKLESSQYSEIFFRFYVLKFYTFLLDELIFFSRQNGDFSTSLFHFGEKNISPTLHIFCKYCTGIGTDLWDFYVNRDIPILESDF